MIVDDEDAIKSMLTRKLEADGYRCEVASDGKEALYKAFMKDFGLVLLDIKMPGLSGMEALPQMVTDHPDTCVIMITAVADAKTAVEAMKLGAYDYVIKPFNLADLSMRVRRALEKRRLVLENREYERRLEQRVREGTAEVQTLLAQKDAFIAQLGHDLKTPLTPVIALLPVLKKRAEDPKSRELIDVITKNVSYMRELVAKTLELAKLSAPDEGIILKDTSLPSQVKNVVEGRRTIFEEKKIRVENRINEEIIVKADSLRLQEALDNIIGNAVKFSHADGSLIIDAKRDSYFVIVSVKDTGIGMTAEQLGRIFDEFYKADLSRHELDSIGLGLSICKRIVEKHGGKIWAESPGLGKGSTLFFTLQLGNGRQEGD